MDFWVACPQSSPLSVIVHDLYIVGLTAAPTENQSPLIVDAYVMKPLQSTLQGFQPISRGTLQFLQVCCIMQVEQLSSGGAPKFAWKRSG
jgi:hypothetical protein